MFRAGFGGLGYPCFGVPGSSPCLTNLRRNLGSKMGPTGFGRTASLEGLGALADQLHLHPVLESQPSHLNEGDERLLARDGAEVDCQLHFLPLPSLAGGLPLLCKPSWRWAPPGMCGGNCRWFHSFIHSFIPSFIHPLIHSFFIDVLPFPH